MSDEFAKVLLMMIKIWSGHFLLFLSKNIDRITLVNRHPELFERALKYEQEHEDGRRFYWNQEENPYWI